MEIVVGIIALVAGFFFIKKFASIDRYFFSDGDPDYEPSGDRYLMLSVIVGALGSAIYFANEIFSLHFNSKSVSYLTAGGVATVAFMSMIYMIVLYKSPGKCFGKCVFMFVACIIGALMGVAGSFIVFAVVAIWLFVTVVGGVLSGDSDKVKVKSNDLIGGLFGGERTLTRESGNIFRDSSGHHYEKNGNNFTQLD